MSTPLPAYDDARPPIAHLLKSWRTTRKVSQLELSLTAGISQRIGRDTQIKRERDLLTKARAISSHCVRPVFISGDHVVIRWQFRFDWLDGTATKMEEIAYQRWEGDRIAEETFFYDPAQRVPIPNPVRSEA